MRIKPLVKGLLTYVPVLSRYALAGTGGTVSARYCYSVWLRHLVQAHQHGLPKIPQTVAELGPGDSLGTGLAAILSGCEAYYALDVKQFARSDRNVRILDQLVQLYQDRAEIPDEQEFPDQYPRLDTYEFPTHLLSKQRLDDALNADRIDHIRNQLLDSTNEAEGVPRIVYFAPWFNRELVRKESVDFVLSQAVMEHVTDLDFTYGELRRWLKPGGWMSHQIDFRCHHTAKQWNGHWAYSDLLWKLIKGNRAYLINREPHSTHVRLLHKHDFQIVCDLKCHDLPGIRRQQLAARFRGMSDEDLHTPGVFVQAIKRAT